MQLVGLTPRDLTLHPTSPSIKSGSEIIFDRSGKHKWQLRADPSFGASVSDVDRLASRPHTRSRTWSGRMTRSLSQAGPMAGSGRTRSLIRPARSGHPTAHASFSADDRRDDDRPSA